MGESISSTLGAIDLALPIYHPGGAGVGGPAATRRWKKAALATEWALVYDGVIPADDSGTTRPARRAEGRRPRR